MLSAYSSWPALGHPILFQIPPSHPSLHHLPCAYVKTPTLQQTYQTGLLHSLGWAWITDKRNSMGDLLLFSSSWTDCYYAQHKRKCMIVACSKKRNLKKPKTKTTKHKNKIQSMLIWLGTGKMILVTLSGQPHATLLPCFPWLAAARLFILPMPSTTCGQPTVS